ncbi:MAG: response regulator [Cyanobacteriota bacterium]|nr:response regulator [Cyanobacteriota bacterium]
MARFVFAAQELPTLLRQQSKHFTTGYLQLHMRSSDQVEAKEAWLLAFFQGRIVFSSHQPLNCKVFLQRLSRYIPRLKLGWSQRAIQVIQERLMRQNSIQELIEGMTQLALLKPGEVEDAIWMNLMADFDRYLFERSGTCRFEVNDLVAQEAPINGFELEPLLQRAAERRDQWATLKVGVPTMLAVPLVNWERINRYKISEEQKQKLHSLTKDGQSLETIAAKLARDRLEVAQMFAGWVKKGLVSLQTPPELLQAQQHNPTTILAVDDSMVMQEILKQSLPNYRVITTGNPSELLNLLFQHQPDLLLMDVTMPGIDGLELCRIVRNLEEFKSIPVVMLTARDGFFDRIKGKLSGATAYLTKPFSEVQLNTEIERLLNLHPASQGRQAKPLSSPVDVPTDWHNSMFNPTTGQ